MIEGRSLKCSILHTGVFPLGEGSAGQPDELGGELKPVQALDALAAPGAELEWCRGSDTSQRDSAVGTARGKAALTPAPTQLLLCKHGASQGGGIIKSKSVLSSHIQGEASQISKSLLAMRFKSQTE